MNTKLSPIAALLLRWYDQNARVLPWRSRPEPYRVWLSEIMLQQTRVETVLPYFERFLAALPDIKSLAQAKEETLLKLWEGLGYYSRVRNLQKAARIVVNEHGGVLPASFNALRALPGFGDYTAGSVGSIAFGLRVPAVDGNVLRVISRVTKNTGDISEPAVKKRITQEVAEVLPDERVGDFNQALMELGATVCLPNGAPRCDACPLAALCLAHLENLTGQIPVKKPRKPRTVLERTILVVVCDGRLALQKRPAKGLLAGMWELPGLDGALSCAQCLDAVKSMGIDAVRISPLPDAKHIFSHVEWHMRGYLIKAASCSCSGLTYATKAELAQKYSVPTAFSAYTACYMQQPGAPDGAH